MPVQAVQGVNDQTPCLCLRIRRNGILQILWDQGWSLNIKTLLERATQHWAKLLPHFKVDAAALAQELSELMGQRLQSLLEEAAIDSDLVQAVAGETVALDRLLSDPGDARQRASLLQSLRSDGELTAVQAVVTRAAKLATKGDLPQTVLSASAVVDASLFEKSSEAGMLSVLNSLEPVATGSDPDRYAQLAQGLIAGASALANFFDGEDSVMVMAEDASIRANRLNLLGVLNNQASVLADFSRISG